MVRAIVRVQFAVLEVYSVSLGCGNGVQIVAARRTRQAMHTASKAEEV
jgi:hypothetical protein